MDQGGARETDDVAPVPRAAVEATLPHLNHVVRAIVQLLLLTGARPKELRELRPRDIDQDGRVEIAKGYWVTLGSGCWATRLSRHKTAHKNSAASSSGAPRRKRSCCPSSKRRPADGYLFSPAEAMARRYELLRASRKSKVQPSQVTRARPVPLLRPGDCYTRRALRQSVVYGRRAAERAAGRRLAEAGEPLPAAAIVPAWTPYQLRHLAAVNLVVEFGWDIARIVLGHSEEEMTRRYGSEDYCKAARAIGTAS